MAYRFDVDLTSSHTTNTVAVLYIVAAFYRIFPSAVVKEERDPVDSDCLDYPTCMIRSGTLPPTSDDLPFKFVFTNESLLEIEKQARLEVLAQEQSLSTPQPDPSQMDLLDEEDALSNEYERALMGREPENQTEPEADLDNLASTSLPPRRQFKREVEMHLGMESESEHYSGPYPRSSSTQLEEQPYESSGLYLALWLTFVISMPALGLYLFVGNMLEKPGFLRGWVMAAGVSTALDVGLLISVALTSEFNEEAILHLVFLGGRGFSFFVVYERTQYLKKILRLQRRPILPEREDEDDNLSVVLS